jgi:hypothetical protein
VSASKRGGVCRVGWGSADCGHHLGYDINSFGYGGTAKKSNDAIFETYGEKFGGGDVIGCALNIEADDGLCKISFCKNGKTLGVAFQLHRFEPLFPKFALKDCSVSVNFGESPFLFPLPKGGFIGIACSTNLLPVLKTPDLSLCHLLAKYIKLAASATIGEPPIGQRRSDLPEKALNLHIATVIKAGLEDLGAKYGQQQVKQLLHRQVGQGLVHHGKQPQVEDGDTLLHVAARLNNQPLARVLLHRGAPMHVKNKWLRAPDKVNGATDETKLLIKTLCLLVYQTPMNEGFSPTLFDAERKLWNWHRRTAFFLFCSAFRARLNHDMARIAASAPTKGPAPEPLSAHDEACRLVGANKLVALLCNETYQRLIVPFL